MNSPAASRQRVIGEAMGNAERKDRNQDPSMENNRNFFITIALSILVLTLWQVFYLGPKTEAQREQARIEEQQQQKQQATQQQAQGGQSGDTPQMPATSGNIPGHSDVAAVGGTLTREAAVAQTQRVEIDTPSLRGSINL